MKIILICLLITLLVAPASSQKTYLPDKSEFLRLSPSSPPNEMFTIMEQRGLVAYRGQDCDDGEGTGLWEDEKGKKYGSNHWIDVHLQIQHYKPAGKFTFDNIMQYNPPSLDLNKKEALYKEELVAGDISRKINIIDVANGKMLVVKDVNTCVQSKFDKYATIFVISYAIIGTTIVWLDANFYNEDVTLAIKIHNEVVDKIQKIGIE